jgi:hypothetical protein
MHDPVGAISGLVAGDEADRQRVAVGPRNAQVAGVERLGWTASWIISAAPRS